MTLSDASLIEQNPWWSQPDAWEGRDPHLRRLAAQPVELPSLVADSIPLAQPAVHVVRFPRQPGALRDPGPAAGERALDRRAGSARAVGPRVGTRAS